MDDSDVCSDKPIRLFRRFTPEDFFEYEAEIDSSLSALAVAEHTGDAAARVKVSIDLGFCLFVTRHEAEAVTVLDTALPLARALGDHRAEIEILLYLATARQYLDERGLAQMLFQEALDKSNETGISEFDHFIWHHRGRCYVEERLFEEARHSFELALSLRQSLGDARLIASTEAALMELAEWRQT